MKTILLSLFFLIPVVAQNGVQKSYYVNGNLESEISYVEDILVGTSFWYYENGNLKQEKTYNNGKLNGFVKNYFENGLLNEEFHVKNGVKDGLHKTYYDNGGLKSVLSYEDGILVKQITLDYDPFYDAPAETYLAGNRQYKIQAKKEELLCDAEVCPIPINGMQALQDSIHYPEHAKLYGLEGTVKLVAEINAKGVVVKTEVLEGIGLGCDEEAQRVVENTKFLPGQNDGDPVKSNLIIHLYFTMDGKPLIAGNISGDIKKQVYKSMNPVISGNKNITTERKVVASNEEAEVKTCELEFCPKPKGGLLGIIDKMVMPTTAKRVGVSGSIIIDVDVDEYGFARDTKIIQGLGYGIDEAVQVAVFETEFDPGIDKGKYTRTIVRLAVPIVNHKTD
nr:TonB family protein [uncultured Sphaerochaeta sp.]